MMGWGHALSRQGEVFSVWKGVQMEARPGSVFALEMDSYAAYKTGSFRESHSLQKLLLTQYGVI